MLCTIAVHPGLAPAHDSIMLLDQRGKPFAFESLTGAPLVITFVSAHCRDACPIVEAQIARCAERFDHSPLAITFLTVTLDPERDNVSDMRRLAHNFDARPPRWIFASGASKDVHALMTRFGVVTQRDARGYATSHSTFVYILDARGRGQQTLLPSDDLSRFITQESLRR